MANPFFSERETDLLLALEAAGLSEEESDPVEEGDDGDEDEDEDEDEEYFKFLCNECGHAFDPDDPDDLDGQECPECGSTDLEVT